MARGSSAQRFWPGPLTLILKRSALAKDFVTGGQDTVGLRVPSHPVAQQLLKEFAGAIAAPSANRFGKVSPTTAAHVREDLGKDVELVLEGGPSEVGIESTIVDLSGAAAVLLRPGHISKEDLEAVIGSLGEKAATSPRHSGGLERHYAPRTPARMVPAHALGQGNFQRERALRCSPSRGPTSASTSGCACRASRRPMRSGSMRRCASSIARSCEQILVEAPPDGAEWDAVRDRLKRACEQA